MRTRDDRRESVLGLALTAVVGFAVGFAGGAVLGGSVGDVHADRVKRAIGRLRRSGEQLTPEALARRVHDALRNDEATRDLDLDVQAPADGLVELTGTVSDALARRAAGDVARAVPGVEVVVNRVLLKGSDLPPPPAAPASRRG